MPAFTSSPLRLALIASAAALAALFGAIIVFERGIGLEPCVLCFWQRYAHWAALALALVAAVLAKTARRRAAFLFLGASALAFLAGAGVAGFHLGVEEGWWQGLPSCQVPGLRPGMTVEDLAAALEARERVVPCDAVPWSLFGISMAGYNLLFSVLVGGALLVFSIKELRR